jgi:hypothetical protein
MNKEQLPSIEMKFFRRTIGYTLFDHKMNEGLLKELKVQPIDKKQKRFK